ncbi:PKD domain-containing protein [Aeromicrobium fastidiosum]|uniref:PKD domain-containing protein n=1 Tax=Aeromicrobium fastidiosum TaxID=52699 RepID=UPI0020235321|nr:PKD domain-containing protein [Aeromicrobium fastidiosum]MCL8252720.1 PKD domain-containing protein [Aeromicrobium fastidiosum]
MRTPRRRRPAALVVLALAAAGLGLAPSPVSAAGEPCPSGAASCVVVTYVQTVDGQTTDTGTTLEYSLNDLKAQGSTAGVYNLRKNPKSQGGKVDKRPVAVGQRVPIGQLLRLDPDRATTATFVETLNADGVPAVLSAADLATPGASDYPFAKGLQPAVFVTDSGKLGYVRPLRNDGEDTNASDYFFSTGRLDLTVHTTGTLLAPAVVSSAGTELDLDASTTFSASLPEGTSGDVLTTRWDFGDGSTKGTKREQPTKTYAKRGTYPVSVTVRTSDGSYGRSAPLEVKIANPPKAPSSGTGGGSDLGGGGGYTGGGGLPAPFDPFEGDVDQPAPSDELPDVEEDPAPTAPVDDGLEPVEGYVLAGAETVPGGTPETIPGTQASTAPAPATQASTRQRIATWAVAAAAVLLLVGLGAASETRWLRHRLRHLRRAA